MLAGAATHAVHPHTGLHHCIIIGVRELAEAICVDTGILAGMHRYISLLAILLWLITSRGRLWTSASVLQRHTGCREFSSAVKHMTKLFIMTLTSS
jgi:hypothetical protein